MAVVPLTFFRGKASTDERYGKRPAQRSMDELLACGFVVVDKPCGPSSHQTSDMVKSLVGASKAGHLGTLDPNVSGVLPVLLGRAPRAASFLMSEDKVYVGIMQFQADIGEKAIRSAFGKFVGEIEQLPPVRSAVARRLRKRTIHSLEILEIHGRDVLFRSHVEAGTYIRKLAHDIGRTTGKGAHLVELRRTAVGRIPEQSSANLHSISEAAWLWKEKKDDSALRRIVFPLERTIDVIGMGRVRVIDSAVDPVCSGAQLMAPGISSAESTIKDGDTVAVMTLKDELVAFGTAAMTPDEMISAKGGVAVKTGRVIMERGIYPRWTKQ
ncbi:putative tRNA pseudouridine synthase B [uncultured archaeon]|nr:putative tRNA pseudouridine synthase B [uncultured archaeon]